MHKYIHILVIILFAGSVLKAQELKQIKGIILSDSLDVIENAYIYNSNYITYSNWKGEFNILAKETDTLIVKSISYSDKYVIVSNKMLEKDNTLHIVLDFRSYEIPEIKVLPWKTYSDFKQAFLDLEIEDNSIDLPGIPKGEPINVPMLHDDNYVSSIGFLISSPLSYLYYNTNNREKDRRNALRLANEKKVQQKIDNKINFQLYSDLTGITDTIEVNKFINYCNFSPQYILNTTEYSIAQAIQLKYISYCQENPELQTEDSVFHFVE